MTADLRAWRLVRDDGQRSAVLAGLTEDEVRAIAADAAEVEQRPVDVEPAER